MAHPSKFVSVNLNKSYGQSPSSSTSSSAFGNARARSSAGGGGMVVLSRPRSSGSAGQKGPPKFSVPPPLNLPSLRKEHERFNPSSAAGSSSRPGSSGFGSGMGSSTMGWTKPGLPLLIQNEDGGTPPGRSGDQRVGSRYLPPSGRAVGQPAQASSSSVVVEKAVVLRGEDFPSLRATITSGPKQKDASSQKERPQLQSPLEMRPQVRSAGLTTNDAPERDEGSSRHSGTPEHSQKQDRYLPGPLPLVQLSHTSDWADDERDTGLAIPERDRHRVFSRNDSARVHDISEGRGARNAEGGSVPSREYYRGDSFGRDLATHSKDGRDVSSWRTPQARDRFNFLEIGVDRDRNGAKASDVSKPMSKESNYGYSPHIDNTRDGFGNGGARDIRYSRRDLGSGSNIQNGRNVADTFNARAADQTMLGRSGDLSNNRYRRDAFQNMISKGPLSSGSKGFSMNDPIINFGREKRMNSNSGKPYIEDTSLDSSDPFSGPHIGDVSIKALKKRKDVLKQVDFHDPVRESFEAELERVQRIQEVERQRVIEDQARALELARREQEERERLVREEVERRRHIEEEAKEAAWKAVQERLEAEKRAEEQKVAREEERRRTLLEEERRKEAARQKLFELEARIAKRQAAANLKDGRLQSVVGHEQLPGSAKERDVLRAADIGDWDEGERMVEHITITSSDSSSMNSFFDTGSRPHSSRDGNFSFMDRGKRANNWRRDTDDNGNSSMFLLQDQENDYRSSRRDAFSSGRGFSRKEIYSNLGPYVRPSSKGGTSEPSQVLDDSHHVRGNRWNIAGDGDNLKRNSDMDVEFLDNDKFGDGMWGSGRSGGSPHPPYAERSYQNSEVDGFSSFGRSRHSLRQPRVPPPPSVSSMHKISFRAATEHPSSASFLDSEMRYQHTGKSDEVSYDHAYHEKLDQPGTTVPLAENSIPSEQKADSNLRYDSQSSLSVSSPPTSPTHLSHDDLDVSEDSQVLPTSATGEQTVLFNNEQIMSTSKVGSTDIMATSSSASLGEDDEWATDNHETMQEQEEYDEDDDGYLEEEEAHEGNDENLDLGQEFEDIQLVVPDTTGEVDQVVLGFDEGVEVRIPISESENTFRKSENAVGVQAGSVGAAQELIGSCAHTLEPEDAFRERNVNESFKTMKETEKALQELVLDPVESTNYSPDSVEATSNLGMPPQQPVPSDLSSPMPSTSLVRPSVSCVSTVASQPDEHVILEFGLFSGPSLIPSPVPAIQIGSIQMPLHLHPHVGPSISQMHSSRPPFFQFGQLRYTSPFSQGILPLAAQSMSIVQPPASSHYSMSQNLGGSVHNLASQEIPSPNNTGDKPVSAPMLIDKQPSLVMKSIDLSQDNIECRQMNALPDLERNEVASRTRTGSSSFGEVRSKYGSASATQAEHHGIRDVIMKKYYRPVANSKEPQLHAEHNSSQFFSREKALGGSKAAGIASGSRGKRFAYTVRNAGSRSFFPGAENSRTDSSGFQRRARRNIRRMEFRVRENVDRRQAESEPFNCAVQYVKPNSNLKVSGNSARYGGKKDAVLIKSTNITIGSENLISDASSSRVVISDGKMDKVSRKAAASKTHISSLENSHAGKRIIKRNGISEDDDDAPLQSGVVRVFKQPGIETPSDEDDFIQVRSKRQILNDRREQREKEMKAKSRGTKTPRNHHTVSHSNVGTNNSKKAVAYLGGHTANNVHSGAVITDGNRFANAEKSPVFDTDVASQSPPPIDTPAVNVDLDTNSENLKSSQRRSVPAISSHGTKFVPGLSFENGAFDGAPMPLDLWDDAHADINQQVMALTQSQLDDSMQSARFDSHASSSIAHEVTSLSTPIMMQEKHFSSANPLNSLLSGEKIQFGAVTSPTIRPPVRRPVSNGIGPPGSGRSDVAIAPKLPPVENDGTVFFDKEKCPDESCAPLEDPEAEAAASAVAVAAISNNDEIVGNMLGVCSVAFSDTTSFSGSDAILLTSGGVTTCQEIAGQSAAEESLTVALPADLSVDTPSLPLWPPLPRPQSSSGTMLSHFPAVPPSHFPCYEINPMLGGPMFAFGPHDESAGTQAQPHRSTTLGSGPLGAWPQCHSTVDSFYGPAAGFAGPFITPGGIPGVQGPPHMVVYNHFTPVGQFGQVGLSFMGTTYIPTGKQPDWKHNPVSSAMGVGEGDISNLNVVSGQHNPPSIHSPIQHMAPGSPLIPMASPLTMFDMNPFQASADMPLQARWSPRTHSVPLSLPLQQHQVDGMPSQFSRGLSVATSAGNNNRFNEPRSSIATAGDRNLSLPKDAVSRFPDELGLVEPPTSRTDSVQIVGRQDSPTSGNNNKGSRSSENSASTVANSSDSSGIRTSSSNCRAPQQQASSAQQYLQPTGYADQRGEAKQKTGSRGEWHRRMGYHGRNQTAGPDKNFGSSKVKQIYVAKSPAGGAAATG